MDDGVLSCANIGIRNDSTIDDSQLQFFRNDRHPSVEARTQALLLSESLELDEAFAFEDDNSLRLQCMSDFSMTSDNTSGQQSASWCSWTRDGLSLSVVTEHPIVEVDSNHMAILQTERPHAQYSADTVIQSLRSLPTMMLRRETLPWFIHPHSHPLSKPTQAGLPQALSTCMGIAQVFASRTLDTRLFLWSTIRAELRRFTNAVCVLPTPNFFSF